MKYLVLLVVAVLVGFLTTFGLQNPFLVQVQFLGMRSTAVPLYGVILVSTLLGVLLSLLLSLPGRIQRQLELRRVRQQMTVQAEEINDLKGRLPAPVMKALPNEAA